MVTSNAQKVLYSWYLYDTN